MEPKNENVKPADDGLSISSQQSPGLKPDLNQPVAPSPDTQPEPVIQPSLSPDSPQAENNTSVTSTPLSQPNSMPITTFTPDQSNTSAAPAPQPSQSSPAPVVSSQPVVSGTGASVNQTNVGSIPNTISSGDNKGSKKKRIVKIGIIASAVVLLTGLGVVFGWYIPNQPENVWSTGLERTGDTFEKLITAATEEDKLEAYKNTELTGSIEASGEGFSVNGSFSSKYDSEDSDSGLAIKMTTEDGQGRDFGIKLLTTTGEGETIPDMYFQVTGIKSLGLDLYVPGLADLEGRWIAVSSEYMKSIMSEEEAATEPEESFTHQDAAELSRAVTAATNEYVFTSDSDKAVLELKEFIGTESLEDDITANRYSAGINKENAKKYCAALIESVMNADAYSRIPGVNIEKKDEEKEKSVKDCQENIDEEIDEDDTFDIWIDKKYKLIHKVRITEEDKEGNYIEIGQTYKGGDVLPMFVSYHSDDSKIDSKFTLELDTKQNTTKGDFVLEQKGDNSYKVNANFEFKPHEGDVQISKPADAISIQEVMNLLGMSDTGAGSSSAQPSAINSRAKDTERQVYIRAIHGNLEVYYAVNGSYPSLAQLNDAAWRAANMAGLDSEALKDPDGSLYVLDSSPSPTQYGYQPTGCNNAGTECQDYLLAAILSDGQIYSKESLN